MSFKRKSDEEKLMKKKSEINLIIADINRKIRQYEKLRDKSIKDAEIAERDNNRRRAIQITSSTASLNATIKGLKDYLLLMSKALNEITLPDQLHKDSIITSIISEEERISETSDKTFIDIGQALNKMAGTDESIKEEDSEESVENKKLKDLLDKMNNRK